MQILEASLIGEQCWNRIMSSIYYKWQINQLQCGIQALQIPQRRPDIIVSIR